MTIRVTITQPKTKADSSHLVSLCIVSARRVVCAACPSRLGFDDTRIPRALRRIYSNAAWGTRFMRAGGRKV